MQRAGLLQEALLTVPSLASLQGLLPQGFSRLSLPPSIQSLMSQAQGSEEVQTPCALQGCL